MQFYRSVYNPRRDTQNVQTKTFSVWRIAFSSALGLLTTLCTASTQKFSNSFDSSFLPSAQIKLHKNVILVSDSGSLRNRPHVTMHAMAIFLGVLWGQGSCEVRRGGEGGITAVRESCGAPPEGTETRVQKNTGQDSVVCSCWLTRGRQPLAYPEGGGLWGFNHPLNLQKMCIVCLQNILSKPFFYVH